MNEDCCIYSSPHHIQYVAWGHSVLLMLFSVYFDALMHNIAEVLTAYVRCTQRSASFARAHFRKPIYQTGMDISHHLTQIQKTLPVLRKLVSRTSWSNFNYSACWSCVGHCAPWRENNRPVVCYYCNSDDVAVRLLDAALLHPFRRSVTGVRYR